MLRPALIDTIGKIAHILLDPDKHPAELADMHKRAFQDSNKRMEDLLSLDQNTSFVAREAEHAAIVYVSLSCEEEEAWHLSQGTVATYKSGPEPVKQAYFGLSNSVLRLKVHVKKI